MARIVGRICSFKPLLAQMTQLHKLSLQVTGFAGAEELMPDMAAVSSLEELRLGMRLTVFNCTAPAQLQPLSVLRDSLQGVQLTCAGTVRLQAAAEHWAAVPAAAAQRSWGVVKSSAVVASEGPLTSAALQGLASQSSCLQQLQHRHPATTPPGSSLPAVEAEQQQQALHLPANAEAAAARVQLPQLRSLSLAGLAPSLWGMAAAVQVTHLELARCGIDGGVVAAVAGSLGQLRLLGLNGNAGVDDTAAASIAQQLQQLTELQLEGTTVTDAGVVQLTGLPSCDV
ncbi:hypothetical protein COO60DRAFT_1657282 [Scenedesmus sp. NREL 46B-D3]|nr:hypothetical protein COO60DRAFT_1657282 [Scenedesmus sp. NREL 46B-D3]